MITGYKWTRADGMAWYDATFGPYAVGAALSVPDAPADGQPCGRGLHVGQAVERCFPGGSFPGLLWHVESDGPVLGEDSRKVRVASLRVTAAAEKPAWIVAVEAALAEIPMTPWFRPSGPPDPTWQHYPTRAAARAAAGDAAGDAAGAAALAAAWDAAGAAAWDAARAAAWDAAWDAAGDAARAAAGDAAWDAAWDAGADAALLARLAVASDLDYPDKAKHEAYARTRWAVWQRGYGLACDVGGRLYTYELA